MQVRGQEGGVTVIDDFAHHPTAVRETLRALAEKYKGRRLVAVFEPRSATSRLAVFQRDYAEAFDRADYVVLSSVFAREKGSVYGRLLDTDDLVADIAARRDRPALCLDGADSIVAHLAPNLREGDVVLVDTGCAVEGYNSDITRTYVFGTPSEEQRRVWDAEKEAQQAAFDAVRPGVPCEEIDHAARRVLERRGFGPDYKLPGLPHRTGHGIGLSIHEAPYLVRGDGTPLRPGMCFSNEPMIVVPGRFGIRLEDHFHVTQHGAAWFTEPMPSIDEPFG